jgi:hypothetical protein
MTAAACKIEAACWAAIISWLTPGGAPTAISNYFGGVCWATLGSLRHHGGPRGAFAECNRSSYYSAGVSLMSASAKSISFLVISQEVPHRATSANILNSLAVSLWRAPSAQRNHHIFIIGHKLVAPAGAYMKAIDFAGRPRGTPRPSFVFSRDSLGHPQQEMLSVCCFFLRISFRICEDAPLRKLTHFALLR